MAGTNFLIMNAAFPPLEPNDGHSHLKAPEPSGRKSFESASSVPNSTHYRSSISSLSESINNTTHSTTLQNANTYTFHLPETYKHSRRDIHVRDAQGTEILYAKMSEHNPLKPDIQFFSNSTSATPVGSAKLRHGKNLKLILEHGEEKEMHNVSKNRDYCFYLPDSAGTSRKVLWTRVNMEGGGGPATGKGKRALRYELGDEGSGEVLAVYDAGEHAKNDFLHRGTLTMSSELSVGEEGGLWVLMGALGIYEKARRRVPTGGIGAIIPGS
ncbi:uncharacterized protein LY89DRAFT_688809 [Mollisia scopiformis]|uniref:Uncharacterized protein n=1 Tax=Mollisia scopiformis TaxID=149040 RepID=A0A194WVI5_MOLSC|nr:uncharacterized protein LY89DRAFT_688809 [Mollisia scopiformis]KUJ11607.1 hypothetical protein LY89DRAFT_688809 [Mollisia scopiformis]